MALSRYVPLALALTLLLGPLPAPAGGGEADASDEWIADSGFEMAPDRSGWIRNDWWTGAEGQRNVAEFVRDTDRPRAGKHCLRMALKDHRGGNLQLTHPLAGLDGGDAVQIRLWVRGASNSPALTVLLDQGAPPWREYFRARVPLADDWREHVLNVTLPQRIDRRNLRLMVLMDQENTAWLDNVRLRRLPARQGGEPLAGNRVANGSFETGRNRWYARFHESGGASAMPRAVEQAIDAEFASRAVEDAPHGRHVLRIVVPRRCGVKATSAMFALRYGHPVEISFAARRRAGAGKLRAMLTHGQFPNLVETGETFDLTSPHWRRCRLRIVPSPATGGVYHLSFTTYDHGTLELDDVRVAEPNAPPGEAPVELGWQVLDGGRPGNIYHKTDQAKFLLRAWAPGQAGRFDVRARVLDVWERPIATLAVPMNLDADGFGQATLRLPTERFGAFKCEFRAGPQERPGEPALLELVYHVVPRLTPLGDVEDSYFGGHFDMTPYNLAIAEVGGYRWLRLHPPMNTKWEVVEPRQGVFRFHRTGIERARRMGFRILGSFQATPDFYADTPPGQTNDWWDNWAPKAGHMDAYERYVARTAKAFEGEIRYWEIWNEPDICFLNVPPGRDKAEVYLELCRRTRKALREAGLGELVLVGGAVTDNDRPFTGEVLRGGLGQHVDAFSFHHYSPGTDALLRRRERIQQWRRTENRLGRSMPVWQTESGIYTGEGATWLRTSGRGMVPGGEMSVAAARTVQNLVFFKAIGVEKFFTYPLMAHPAGRDVSRNDWQSVIDVNGIPYSPLPAHAAAVHFLEGARPAGVETANIGEATVLLARFARDDVEVFVVWSTRPVGWGAALSALQLRAPLGPGGKPAWSCYDMMANPIELPDHLTADPIYLVAPGGDEAS